MNIVFRVDSSLEIGTGHVMRCLTLAEQLERSGCKVFFICRQLEGSISKLITDKRFNLFEIQSDKIVDIFKWYQENWQQDSLSTINLIKKAQFSLTLSLLIIMVWMRNGKKC